MIDFNQQPLDFYIDYINKELYKSKFTISKSYNFNKLIFINKTNKSSYWFPAHTGRHSLVEPDKLKLKKYIARHSVHNFTGFDFLPTFEIFINSYYHNHPLSEAIKSPLFYNYLTLANESIRKQELKKHTPRIRWLTFNIWKYWRYNDYVSLKYYYNYEPHRIVSRLRKFNFLAVNSWFPTRKWLFAHRNMKLFYLKWRKTQKFEFRFFRFEGMSMEYWAKQQLQYNYLTVNSSDILSDPYNSNFFRSTQFSATKLDFNNVFPPKEYSYLYISFFFWLLKVSSDTSNSQNLPIYFSNSYDFHQISNASKYKYLKNFFAYNTPKFAHAHYVKLEGAHGGWEELRHYFSFFKPSYWNLRRGLDSYPHEHWTWEDILWWEDTVPLYFSRFDKRKRREKFIDLKNIDSSNFNWFYRSWFHEEIFTELHASYYRTYYNIDYLTPGWRISTDYPKKRMGHFDPKWQERLYEYVIYPYMDLFHPSTKRYYINYSNHPDYVDPKSFLVLNFAWKSNFSSLFIYRFRPKFFKVLRNKSRLNNPLVTLKPSFLNYYNSNNLVNFFPVLTYDKEGLLDFLETYQKALIFLINVFSKSNTVPDLSRVHSIYLFKYLNSFNNLNFSESEFTSFVNSKNWTSYIDLLNAIISMAFIDLNDITVYRERVLAEYIAFKRFYNLLISEYGNAK